LPEQSKNPLPNKAGDQLIPCFSTCFKMYSASNSSKFQPDILSLDLVKRALLSY
jgi:hypothetical protein